MAEVYMTLQVITGLPTQVVVVLKPLLGLYPKTLMV
jgi:hypothetical protein